MISHTRKAEVCPKHMPMVLPDVEHLGWVVIVPDIHRTCGTDEELRATGGVGLGLWEEALGGVQVKCGF